MSDVSVVRCHSDFVKRSALSFGCLVEFFLGIQVVQGFFLSGFGNFEALVLLANLSRCNLKGFVGF